MTTPPKPSRWRVPGVKLDIDADPATDLTRAAAKKLGIRPKDIQQLDIARRAFDARSKRPHFVYTLDLKLARGARPRNTKQLTTPPPPYSPTLFKPKHRPRVAVVGAGPAGLFAALRLAMEGMAPVLFERGKAVEARGLDVLELKKRGRLNPESNICFGEGGAGTYSDGKLVTRLNAPQVRWVLETLHNHGAGISVLQDAKPHVGTDALVPLLIRLRETLTSAGVVVRFGTRIEGLLIESGEVRGVLTSEGPEPFEKVILATGHSARDLYETLHHQGLPLVAKPFAVGFRIEHPQALINKIQYGEYAQHPSLPVADYRLTAKVSRGAEKRGIYSFCMCPGGEIVPAATEPESLVVNGMSHAARDGGHANAALVVTVNERDFAPFGDGPMAGVAFQRAAEAKAFALGGGGFVAPAQRAGDFLEGKTSARLPKTTYRPGVVSADLSSIYSPALVLALREGLQAMGSKMRGFMGEEAVLVGAETRTSSPLRLQRTKQCQALGFPSLYPCGEGAGYAGGIMSSAVDGLRVAEALLQALS